MNPFKDIHAQATTPCMMLMLVHMIRGFAFNILQNNHINTKYAALSR